MIPVLSRDEVRAFDRACIELGLPAIVLMENAGRGVVDAIERHWETRLRGARAVIVAGPGNNGGDGFVAARHLATRGAEVQVFLAGSAEKLAGETKSHFGAMNGVGLVATEVAADLRPLREALLGATFVVDALFGTGLSRPIEGLHASIIEAIRESKRRVVAVDIPSGLDANTGAELGVALPADLTVTFAAHKLGLVTPQGARLAGKVVVADLGAPCALGDRLGHAAGLVERRDVARLLSPRASSAHKNGAGHVVVFAGSPGHVGAAVMCAQAALRAGAGLVTIATWPEAAVALDARVVEVMTVRLDVDDLARSLDPVLGRAKVVVVGPGFGRDERARTVVRYILSKWQGPSVIDADALSMFADEADVFASSKGAAVLTPHPGELGVLLGTSAKEVEADRFAALAACVERARSVTVLKGAHTLVGAPDERPVVNSSGNAALATAGSGDVLAGTIGALACALDPFEAAFAGVYLHGLGAEAWSTPRGDRGLLAHEIADEYPRLLGQLVAEGARAQEE